MGELRPWHIIVILAVLFVLFGYKKLPDATRSLGRSLRILKTEVKTLHDDDQEPTVDEIPAALAAPRPIAAPPPVASHSGVVPPSVLARSGSAQSPDVSVR
jgi:sec-independent protein translocase protein TatA